MLIIAPPSGLSQKQLALINGAPDYDKYVDDLRRHKETTQLAVGVANLMLTMAVSCVQGDGGM